MQSTPRCCGSHPVPFGCCWGRGGAHPPHQQDHPLPVFVRCHRKGNLLLLPMSPDTTPLLGRHPCQNLSLRTTSKSPLSSFLLLEDILSRTSTRSRPAVARALLFNSVSTTAEPAAGPELLPTTAQPRDSASTSSIPQSTVCFVSARWLGQENIHTLKIRGNSRPW